MSPPVNFRNTFLAQNFHFEKDLSTNSQLFTTFLALYICMHVRMNEAMCVSRCVNVHKINK